MKKYFLHNGTEQRGPFDIADLKSENISKETPIWFDGITEWTSASKIEELKSLFIVTPPPFTTKSPTSAPPIRKTETKQSETFYQPKKEKSTSSRYALIFVGILLLGGLGLFLANRNNSNSGGGYVEIPQTYEEQVMTLEETENSQPTNFLTADGNYNENFWGNKLKVHGKIINKATVASYKDALVKVTYYSKTNTEIGSKEYTIYEMFPPNSTTNFELKIENYKEVNSIGWDVINASTIK
jgi:GYF domain 2